jgi:hypothetical protein
MHRIHDLKCNVVQDHSSHIFFRYSDDQLNDFVRENALVAIEDVFEDIQIQLDGIDTNHVVAFENITITLPNCYHIGQGLNFQKHLYKTLFDELYVQLPSNTKQLLQRVSHERDLIQAIKNKTTSQLLGLLLGYFSNKSRSSISFIVNSNTFESNKLAEDLKRLLSSDGCRHFLVNDLSKNRQALTVFLELLDEGAAEWVSHFLELDIWGNVVITSHNETDDISATGSNKLGENTEEPLRKRQVITLVGKQALIDFSLIYLSADRGGRFNRLSYLRSVTQKIAAHNNMSELTFNVYLKEVMRHKSISQELKADLTEIVGIKSEHENVPEAKQLDSNLKQAFWQTLEKLKHYSVSQWYSMIVDPVNSTSRIFRQYVFNEVNNYKLLDQFLIELPEEHRSKVFLLIVTMNDERYAKESILNELGLSGHDFCESLMAWYETLSKDKLDQVMTGFMQGTALKTIVSQSRVVMTSESQSAVSNSESSNTRLVRYIHRALQQTPNEFCQQIMGARQPFLVLQTIGHYYNFEQIRRLSDCFKKGLYSRCASLLPWLRKSFQHIRGVKQETVDQVFRFSVLWLAFKCRQGDSKQPNMNDFLEACVAQLSIECGFGFIERPRIYQSLYLRFDKTTLDSNMLGLDIEHALASLCDPGILDKAEASPQIDDVLLSIESYFLFGGAVPGREHWKSFTLLLLPHQQSTLRVYFRSPVVRTNFLKLDSDIQASIFHKLEPQFAASIVEIWTTFGGFSDANDIVRSDSDIAEQSKSETFQISRRNIVEFTLLYCGFERGSDFNVESFVRCMVKYVSTKLRINSDELLNQLTVAFQGSLKRTSLASVFQFILSSDDSVRKSNLKKYNSTDKPSIEALVYRSNSVLRGAELRSELEAMIAGTLVFNVNHWKRNFELLAAHYADQLTLMVQKFQRNLNLMASISKQNEAATILKSLMIVVENVLGGSQQGKLSPLVQCLQSAADQSSFPEEIWVDALTAMLSGEVINLEEIKARNVKSDEDSFQLAEVNMPTNPRSPNLSAPQLKLPVHGESVALSYLTQMHTILGVQLGERGALLLKEKILDNYHTLYRKILNSPTLLSAFSMLAEPDKSKFLMVSHEQRLLDRWPLCQALRMTLADCDSQCLELALTRVQLSELVDSQVPFSSDQYVVKVITDYCAESGDFPNKESWSKLQQLWQHQAILAKSMILNRRGNDEYSQALTMVRDTILSVRSVDLEPDEKLYETLQCWQSDSNLEQMSFRVNTKERLAKVEAELLHTPNRIKQKSTDVTSVPQKVRQVGIAILSPYLPMLFQKLSLLNNGTFDGIDSKLKAYAVMQYLCEGISTKHSFSSSLVSLSWFVAGLAEYDLSTFQRELTAEEMKLCDELLAAVISHWSALGATSIEGLRETFMQREGVMHFEEEKGWLLCVSKRPFDVLLAKLPWSFSVIKHSFMTDCIFVEWQ